MRKFSVGIILSTFLGICLPQISDLTVLPAMAQEMPSEAVNKEDAELLFGEALDFKKKGDMAQAIDSYSRAMRIDRSILAFDDEGLIEALKNDCIDKLKTNPEDVKILETLGFVYAVCYSDYESAISSYEKVMELVTDDRVKERTANLIERLRESARVQDSFHTEVTSQIRDERLKGWSELERADKLGADVAIMQEKSAKLAESYKMKDSLKNRVPQLEKELQDLQSDYDKANRLFYTVSDKDLYERRRRRLKDQIAEKEIEVGAAKEELEEAEEVSSSLERELADVQKERDASPIRSYDDNPGTTGGDDGSVAQPPANDYGAPDDENEEPLPAVEHPDFPDQEPITGEDMENLIDNL